MLTGSIPHTCQSDEKPLTLMSVPDKWKVLKQEDGTEIKRMAVPGGLTGGTKGKIYEVLQRFWMGKKGHFLKREKRGFNYETLQHQRKAPQFWGGMVRCMKLVGMLDDAWPIATQRCGNWGLENMVEIYYFLHNCIFLSWTKCRVTWFGVQYKVCMAMNPAYHRHTAWSYPAVGTYMKCLNVKPDNEGFL